MRLNQSLTSLRIPLTNLARFLHLKSEGGFYWGGPGNEDRGINGKGMVSRNCFSSIPLPFIPLSLQFSDFGFRISVLSGMFHLFASSLSSDASQSIAARQSPYGGWCRHKSCTLPSLKIQSQFYLGDQGMKAKE
jgi:hypothetical protein